MSSSKAYQAGTGYSGQELRRFWLLKDRPAGACHQKQTAGGRRGEGEETSAEKTAGMVSGQHGMEAPPSQTHGGPCDYTGAAALSSGEKKCFLCQHYRSFQNGAASNFLLIQA